jgi:hypothetical protein
MNIDEILKQGGSDKDVLGNILGNRLDAPLEYGLFEDLIKWKDREVYKALRQNNGKSE